MARKNFYPHVIYFGSHYGRQPYWDIKSSSIDLESGRINISFVNGLEYRLALSYLLSPLKTTATSYRGAKEMVHDLRVPWRTRSLCWPHESAEKGHYDIVRVYDNQFHVYYWFSAETLLMLSEAAYEDFASERYPEYAPGYHEWIHESLRNQPDSVEIVVSPQVLKTRAFFHVVEVKWFRRPGIILFFTQGGDRYGVSVKQYAKAGEIAYEIGIDRFKPSRGMHAGLSLLCEQLTTDKQRKLDRYVELLAFELDYRFRGHQKDFQTNQKWNVYPAQYMISPEFIWPSQYSREYE